GLDQDIPRTRELSYQAFAAHHATEEPALCCLPKVVLHMPFPGDQMPCVYHVLFARPEPLAVDGTERGYQQKTRAGHLKHKQSLASKKGLRTAKLCLDLETGV